MTTRNAIKAVSLAIIVAVSAWACDSGPTSSSPQTPSSAETTASSSQNRNSIVSKSSWPPGTEDTQALETNLTRRNYNLILDGSGSMAWDACGSSEKRIDVAKKAIIEWAKTVPEDANLGLLVFSYEGIVQKVPLGTGKENRDAFMREVRNAPADGGTPLYSAVKHGYEVLEKQGRKQLGYGEYHLVVVTDGEANLGENPQSMVDYIVSSSPVVITTIGFCIGNKHSLNQPGRVVYHEANNPSSLRAGLKDVLAESPVFDATVFEKQ